jgi:NAD(P)-dependent dehydrogenase (short-subunit alcohol dehydrogenase family)
LVLDRLACRLRSTDSSITHLSKPAQYRPEADAALAGECGGYAFGAGRIVGALGALQAGAGMGPYAVSKAGVHRLTEALAAEYKGKITVNAVLPSIIDTSANRASMPKADFTNG